MKVMNRKIQKKQQKLKKKNQSKKIGDKFNKKI